MKEIYTVGVKYEGSTFRITCRKLPNPKNLSKGSAHWKIEGTNPRIMFDTREPADSKNHYTILFEGEEDKAKFFAETLKQAYSYQGVKKLKVMNPCEE